MGLSIVATLYCSAPHVQEFHARATAVAREFATNDYEIVFVNDGSPDNSLDLVLDIAKHDPRVVVVDLSRNFGHHKAMMTGLDESRGDYVFLIDSDLEEEPEWLLPFSAKLAETASDVVFGVQIKRKGGVFERVSGYIYYKMFRLMTGVNQPDNIVTARLMTRRYVDSLTSHKERELSIGGIWHLTGFQQTEQAIVKHSSSKSTYSLSRKLSLLVNTIASFSSKPLTFIFYCGLFLSMTSFLFVLILVYRYVFVSIPPSGYTSLITSIWFFSGLMMLFLGILGIYLSKIFIEVKQRPYTIIRAVYRSEDT